MRERRQREASAPGPAQLPWKDKRTEEGVDEGKIDRHEEHNRLEEHKDD